MVAPTQFKRLDKVQRWYLHELGLQDAEAFVEWNFAPPSSRRAISLLRFLHKLILGQCHPMVAAAFPLAGPIIIGDFHTSALDPCCGEASCNHKLHPRSLFAYIYIYNRFPQAWIDAQSVSTFQKKLTHFAKVRAQANHADWRILFQDLTIHSLYG